MDKPTGMFRNARIELHDNEVIPSTLELPLHGGELGAREPLLPDGSGESGLAFDECEPSGGGTIIRPKHFLDEITALLIKEYLHERARIEVDRQSLSSLT